PAPPRRSSDLEDLARGDPDSAQHVTCRAATRSGRGLAPQAKDRTILDAGGDPQRQGAGAVVRAGTPALGARAIDDPTRPAALGTWLGEGEEPLVLGDHTSAGAGGTGVDGGSRLGPRARALGTRRRPLHLDGGGDAAGGVLEADAQVGLDVGTSLRTAPLAVPEPEHVAETEAAQEILKVLDANLLLVGALAEATRSESSEPGTTRPEPAHLVVLAPLLGVGQHRVGLGDLLESLLGLGIVGIGVGMVLLGELAIRLLDVLGGRVLVDPEDPVEVLLQPG